ncbi:MAG: divalent-cation tolerance protein CutA [Bryobacteraceae bacterium]|nr:divalent-cation tolerance protein CutA [Bryobacteraceae bacterium]
MTDKIVAISTCGSEEEAEKVARALVDSRLAACVNISSPIRSIYRWKGAVETEREWMLVIKTRRGLVEQVREMIQKQHSYDVPEFIVLPIVDGSERYLDWIDQETVPLQERA